MTVRNEALNTNTTNGSAVDHDVIDINEIGRLNKTVIRYTVNGFWSHDPISIYVTREFKRQDADVVFYWKATVSWSCGGRDKTTLPSDIDATVNFANALKLAASAAMYIEGESDKLEASYQAKRAEEKVLEKEQAEREKAAFDADPAMGEEVAKRVVKVMKEMQYTVVSFRTRGKRDTKEFKIERTPAGRLTIRDSWTNYRISKEEFIEKIKDYSNEYYIR